MDTLTHALSGALLARATVPKDLPPRSLPRRVASRPVSPFNWTVFVSDAREHHYAHVNLVRDAPGKEAWDSPPLAFFRWFAERPAFDGRTGDPECIWFLDLRLVNPGRDWVPFRFICHNALCLTTLAPNA